jgi:hypothetical protein
MLQLPACSLPAELPATCLQPASGHNRILQLIILIMHLSESRKALGQQPLLLDRPLPALQAQASLSLDLAAATQASCKRV